MIPLLYPFQRYGLGNEKQESWLPDSPLALPAMEKVAPVVAATKIEGVLTPFHLYLYQNRVFFHIANDRTMMWSTFREKPAAAELVSWWQGEVLAERIGRFVRFYQQFSFNTLKNPLPYERQGQLSLHYDPIQIWAIIAENEATLVREWCMNQWFFLPPPAESTNKVGGELSLRGRHVPSIWRRHRRFPRLRSRVAHALTDELCLHSLTPTEIEQARIEWMQGTFEEMEKLLQAWLCLRTVASHGLPLNLSTLRLKTSPRGRIEITTFPRAVGLELPPAWIALLEREFQIRGFIWKAPNFEQEFFQTNPERKNLRLLWSIRYFQTSMHGPRGNEISSHDQLEAYHTLADWLRPLVSPNEADLLLQEAREPVSDQR